MLEGAVGGAEVAPPPAAGPEEAGGAAAVETGAEAEEGADGHK